MIVLGITAEYDPFHKGHEALIREAGSRLKADAVIVAMSQDFTQRGDPAMFQKRKRAEAAILGGADLVLGLPVTGTLQSAEGFARSGVGTLLSTGVVTHIAFGAGDPDPHKFKAAGESIDGISGSPLFSSLLKEGYSYPAAIAHTLCQGSDLFDEAFFLDPNNILGIEYQRALTYFGSDAALVPFLRKGSGHRDLSLGPYASAGAIRKACSKAGEDTGDLEKILSPSLPPSSLSPLIEEVRKQAFVLGEDLDTPLALALIKACEGENMDRPDLFSEDLYNRVLSLLPSYRTREGMIRDTAGKNLTAASVSRLFTSLVLGIRRKDIGDLKALSYAPYLRILAFRKSSGPLLKAIKERSPLPLIIRAKDLSKLKGKSLSLYQKDLSADRIWKRLLYARSGILLPDDSHSYFSVL